MTKTIAIVQARLGSSRLKRKVARKLGGQSLLELVVRRVTDCQQIDAVVVAAADTLDDREIARLVPPDVPVFFGSERDVLARFAAAIEKYRPDAVVRVCPDNPFLDPVFIDRLAITGREHPECDYISFASSSGRPAVLSAVGLFAEYCRADALLAAAREATLPADREHVTRYLYSHPEKFHVRLIPIPSDLDRDDVRLTVDFEEDFEHAQWIYDALGPEDLDWRQIAELLRQQPRLRQRMAHLNRENAKV